MHKLQHILIIDDDQINNLFSQIILEDADVSKLVSVCNSVAEALDFLRDAETNGDTDFPDLILLDISMPTLDGFDFLDRYYALGYHQRHNTFVSMFTASDEQEHVARANKYDVVVGFIKKPLSIPTLHSILTLHASSRTENNLE
ncbi:response regulator [Pontibacter akesuensis]|uniref:Response regulator receiver domain-containing protein n=1 Tax=Pontibacter akesuensis TaxID=388950 RepID=A0A1I7K0S7_9BACT|nr:response regulator [Pontibacter akesuensis]GHA75987.1 response regulator [Pontibacter akesuensis]SFU91032.1 Response regulator receiver domain-containing protein [Pontibacter akesuensis]